MRALSGLLCLLAAGSIPGTAEERWRQQYFYDKPDETLAIVDLQCPSAMRCLAAGAILDTQGAPHKHTAVLTSDGGKTWTLAPLPARPISLFFLNDSLGWLLTENGGLYETTEMGRNWKPLGRIPAAAFQVYFANEKDGWAAAAKKKVFETHDGGHHWTGMAAAAEPPGDTRYSAYTWIAMAGKLGVITGLNQPPHMQTYEEKPEWMDPANGGHRDTPHLSYSLTTADGGKTWRAAAGSLLGQVSRVRLGEDGVGLGLVEYSAGFKYPSEVYKIDMRSGKTETVFRDPHFFVTDVWVHSGTAYLAGRAVEGTSKNLAPGKVRILRSTDWTSWQEQAVYYQAVGYRAMLAGAPDGSMWVATGSGMILKLMP